MARVTSLTKWPPGTSVCKSCTGKANRDSGARISGASGGDWSAGTTSFSKWTRIIRTIRSICLTFWLREGDLDLVIGSRYVSGVNVINWPMSRLLLSWFANKYARVVTGLPLSDATAGFKCFRREVLEAIDFGKVGSTGYAFQIEMDFRAWKKGFRVGEVPIVFVDREAGESRMSGTIVREAVWRVWALRFSSLFGRL